ncbi:hypothetical protein CC80DRAFT_550397 [Byssothecium circinans]|uniref:Uncharacterized protein n=1 Tax=Byssothecium circinans TaxID=147558 RepID=A0A6A5TNZ5_9PLEO|nr:hypothetical protein CC80DRAFT_550397 [Byssothecium circinans]
MASRDGIRTRASNEQDGKFEHDNADSTAKSKSKLSSSRWDVRSLLSPARSSSSPVPITIDTPADSPMERHQTRPQSQNPWRGSYDPFPVGMKATPLSALTGNSTINFRYYHPSLMINTESPPAAVRQPLTQIPFGQTRSQTPSPHSQAHHQQNGRNHYALPGTSVYQAIEKTNGSKGVNRILQQEGERRSSRKRLTREDDGGIQARKSKRRMRDDHAHSSTSQPSVTTSAPLLENVTIDEDEEHLEVRIREGISFSRSTHATPDGAACSTDFKILITTPPCTSLTLLREAHSTGIAFLINESIEYETYSLRLPPVIRTLHAAEPQWWVGLSAAEIRAGPIRTAEDVKEAAQELKSIEYQNQKSAKKPNGKVEWQKKMLGPGLRRQILGLPMDGEIPKERVNEAMRLKGHLLPEEAWIDQEKRRGRRRKKAQEKTEETTGRGKKLRLKVSKPVRLDPDGGEGVLKRADSAKSESLAP